MKKRMHPLLEIRLGTTSRIYHQKNKSCIIWNTALRISNRESCVQEIRRWKGLILEERGHYKAGASFTNAAGGMVTAIYQVGETGMVCNNGAKRNLDTVKVQERPGSDHVALLLSTHAVLALVAALILLRASISASNCPFSSC